MNKKFKVDTIFIGLFVTIALAVFIILFSTPFYEDERLQQSLFDVGIDSLGALIAAGLFYGCMYQKGYGIREFRLLILLVSLSFTDNILIHYTILAPEWSGYCFALCLVSKLMDLVMIFLFYRYIRKTLGFNNKLSFLVDRYILLLLGIQAAFLMLNVFFSFTFFIDESGMYQATGLSFAEDIFLGLISLITTVLIINSDNPRSQKAAALTFIILPLVEYIITGGLFGNSAQYGVILMSLIIMYCVIFNEKNKKLAATEAELNMATVIQAGLLPSIFPAFPERPEFDIYASMDPAKEVGGDFYDFFMIDDDHLGMVIADVSGKGVPAALFMMRKSWRGSISRSIPPTRRICSLPYGWGSWSSAPES